MILIGISGQPAGGKSAVAAILHRSGAGWVDADRIAHEVLANSDVIARLVMRFGDAILDPDGKIDRRTLGQMVFGDDEKARTALRYLESVVHPETRSRIRAEIANAFNDSKPVVVLDVPLLFESQWDVWCDEVWFIDTPRQTVMDAAKGRGWSVDVLDKRIANQLCVEEKRRLSTRVIDNHGTLKQLQETVEAWWQRVVCGTTESGSKSVNQPNRLTATERLSKILDLADPNRQHCNDGFQGQH